jgi:hypothetical protein
MIRRDSFSFATLDFIPVLDEIETRVYGPPRAFLTDPGSYALLTQHRAPRESNSEGVLIPAGTLRTALTPHAGDVEWKRGSAARGVSPRETQMGNSSGNWNSDRRAQATLASSGSGRPRVGPGPVT